MKAVSVGCYLRRDPGRQPHQGRRQRPTETEHPLETRKGDLYTLPLAVLVGPLCHQRDPAFGQGMTQRFAPVGEVPEEPAGEIVLKVRLGEQFLRQAYLRHVCRRKLVGERHPVRRAEQMQLYPVYAEGTSPDPCRSRETRGLSDLPGMQRGKQGGVDQQGLRIAYQLGNYLLAQGL